MTEEFEKKNNGSSCEADGVSIDTLASDAAIRLTDEEQALRVRVQQARARALEDAEGYRQKENAPGRRPRIPRAESVGGADEPQFFDTILLGSDKTKQTERKEEHSAPAPRREISAEEFFSGAGFSSDAPIVARGQTEDVTADRTTQGQGETVPPRVREQKTQERTSGVDKGERESAQTRGSYLNDEPPITELPPFTPVKQSGTKPEVGEGRVENFDDITRISSRDGVNLDLHIIDETPPEISTGEEVGHDATSPRDDDSADMRIDACGRQDREFLYVGGSNVGRITVDGNGNTAWYNESKANGTAAEGDSDIGFTPIRRRRTAKTLPATVGAEEQRYGEGTEFAYMNIEGSYPDPRRSEGDVGTDYRYPDPRRSEGDVGTDYRYSDPRRSDGDVGTDYRYPDPRRSEGDVGTDYRYPDPRRTAADADTNTESQYPEPYRRQTGEMDVTSRYPDGDGSRGGYEYGDEYSYPENTDEEISELDKLGYYHLSDIAAQTERDEELSRAYDEFLEGKGYTPIGGGIVAHRDYAEQRKTDVAAVKARIEIGIGRLEKECGEAEFSYSRTLENRRERRLRRLTVKRLDRERKRLYKALNCEKRDNKRYYDFLKLDLASLKLPEGADRQKLLQMRKRLVELLLMRDEYNQRLLEVYTGSKNGGGMRSDGVYAAEYKARKKAYKKHRRLARIIASNRIDPDDKRMLFALMDESITLHGRRAAMVYLLTKEKVRAGARREALAEKKAAERAIKKNKRTLERVEAKTVVEARKKHKRRRAMIWGWSALIVIAAIGFFVWIFHDAIGDLFLRLGQWLNDTFGWNIF